MRTDAGRIAALALPALVVLAAEPLYVLVDTAVVGHLGGTALASLAVGGTVISFCAFLGSVLAYGTTGRAARRYGAGDRAAAVSEGVQASWLAFAAGMVILVGAQFAAGPVVRTLGGSNPDVTHGAIVWLRIAALGAPGLLLATAGNGWMRGVQDTRRPLYYVLGANLFSAALSPVLVYGAGLGLAGSAVANVAAQTTVGVLFVTALLRERVPLMPHAGLLRAQLSGGRDLLIRGSAFQVCFVSMTAVASRFGAASLGAHQIAWELWLFCSLLLDAIAIAAQALVGAVLGASQADQARALARRFVRVGLVCGLGLGALIAAGEPFVPHLFSGDPHVIAQAHVVWPWFAAMQPMAAIVFALDGVLIGAGDLAFLRNVTLVAGFGAFLPAIWLALALHWGLTGIWFGLTLFVVVRLVGNGARVHRGRWAVTGAVRT
ncbi:MAG TPA: MATE family efflux transporter [Micromonosporaceae bacterium]|nr:MATE family efflux transporter [Micromonosporaceae bacterium]